MKQLVITYLSSSLFMTAFARLPISGKNNEMRSGDILCKVKVDYVSSGDRRQNQVWKYILPKTARIFYRLRSVTCAMT